MKVIYITLCFLSHLSLASDPNIDSLKKLGKEKLIALAVEKLHEPTFDPNQYDRITVKANEKSLIVEFAVSIRLYRRNSCYYDHVSVALVGSGTGKSLQGECDNPKFYHRSESDQRKIDFVFDAINRSEEIGHIPDKKLPNHTTMEISEHGSYFYVENSDWSTFSHYKVNKLSGKISEAEHKHYAREGNHEHEEFEIIHR